MRSTIDIDETLLQQAMELTHARTKREAIDSALREIVRKERIERLKRRGGSGCTTLTLRELERLRRLG